MFLFLFLLDEIHSCPSFSVCSRIFSVLSAILYLGNVTYEMTADGEGVTAGPADVLKTLSELLKVNILHVHIQLFYWSLS